MESGDDTDLREAAALLREAVRIEPDNAGAWRFLGIAEGRRGKRAPSALALAEQAVLVRNARTRSSTSTRASSSSARTMPTGTACRTSSAPSRTSRSPRGGDVERVVTGAKIGLA